MEYNCGDCKWFRIPRAGKKSCSDRAKTKWSAPCAGWTPKDELSPALVQFREMLLTVPAGERPVADWILQQVLRTDSLETATGYQTDERIDVFIENTWVKARIKTILSEEELVGYLKDGREFQVPFKSIRKRGDHSKAKPLMRDSWTCVHCGNKSKNLSESSCQACHRIRGIYAACKLPGEHGDSTELPIPELRQPESEVVTGNRKKRVRST
jgi:hypothetical protein